MEATRKEVDDCECQDIIKLLMAIVDKLVLVLRLLRDELPAKFIVL